MAIEKTRDETQKLVVETIDDERRPHEDQYVHYTHEMTDGAKEGSGRFVVRAVPLLYGFLVGGLIDNLSAGLAVGASVSAMVDLTMGEGSLLRPLLRPFAMAGCPVVAVLANGLGRGIGLLGLPVPNALRDVRCGVS
ncbi:MAG: hypothetical protein H6953_15280 [Chromatiaceae bacterium]|nr:hypothetical protein [Gammaproteobacteria bacterium]MCP5306805.1 hypothetical protein [Chromatiaceae bacterium]MCP5316109.1 hypothetical protein [Chromatiaceae bacterium]